MLGKYHLLVLWHSLHSRAAESSRKPTSLPTTYSKQTDPGEWCAYVPAEPLLTPVLLQEPLLLDQWTRITRSLQTFQFQGNVGNTSLWGLMWPPAQDNVIMMWEYLPKHISIVFPCIGCENTLSIKSSKNLRCSLAPFSSPFMPQWSSLVGWLLQATVRSRWLSVVAEYLNAHCAWSPYLNAHRKAAQRFQSKAFSYFCKGFFCKTRTGPKIFNSLSL